MSESPLPSYYCSPDVYITPSRKPTQHHCNADKKHTPFLQVDPAALAPLCRNLFAETPDHSRPYAAGVNAKLLR